MLYPSRRQFLAMTAATLAVGAAPATMAASSAQRRSLKLRNLHTGETVEAVFLENGDYRGEGLKSLKRVLKPGGELFMFEHTGSNYFPFKPMMNLMTLVSRKIGPDMNRTTVENVVAAGYELRKVTHVYMDVVKTIHATPI